MDPDDDRWFDKHYGDDGLTVDQLAEIERWAAGAIADSDAGSDRACYRFVRDDVPALLAEVRRLRGLIYAYTVAEN